jgi:hypothetical protein
MISCNKTTDFFSHRSGEILAASLPFHHEGLFFHAQCHVSLPAAGKGGVTTPRSPAEIGPIDLAGQSHDRPLQPLLSSRVKREADRNMLGLLTACKMGLISVT